MTKLKADRLPFAGATEADIKDGQSQKIVYAPELKKALDDIKNLVYSGPIDEYSVDTQFADFIPNFNAVAQMWEIVQFLMDRVSKPNIEIIDASLYDNAQNQGDVVIRIPLVSYSVYGQFYAPPIYKIINGSLVPRIYLGDSTTVLFTDQLLPGAMLIPYQDANEHWHYIKA